MLSKKIADAINKQINMEWFSAYLYLDISNYYSFEGLNGFENWFNVQAQEERDHAMLFRTYLLNNDCAVELETIAAPDMKFTEYLTPLRASLEHEQLVTASINNIYDLAHQEKDFRTMQFLDWFIQEQGEEEKNASDNIRKFELFGSEAKGLYLLDQEFAARTYTAPSLTL